ncbi:LacI family DNA-binding transcriptional regulator [Frankia sp. Ag45/Mut15]|uniref:LacI family DNA-binding transcriptional regulator n=2 Tax=Frankia umida TaxID=573489 RepID=A0ABT0K3S4_9ACTN|nr:LacI family DNA-binding transcriptional regulator [Frankia umida]MCK9878154.1 LacI family DNA-binding transcriptional regulator [Frankia umida]
MALEPADAGTRSTSPTLATGQTLATGGTRAAAAGTGGPRAGSVMRDVARLAGVSHQTVSRVLNDHPHVREETRQRVLEAVAALGYRRNLAARALVTRRTGTLGIVGFETTLFGPASVLYAIEDAARRAGYFVSVTTIRDLDRRSILDALERLRMQSVEAVIAIAHKPAVTAALAQLPTAFPRVAVGGSGGEETVPGVRVDNVAGARLATQHLLDLGHSTVHHLAGPADWPEARQREEGWRATLEDAGATVPPVRPRDTAQRAWDARTGYEQGRTLARDPSVTAVFCANDALALGVLRALHEAGRIVPDEVSVVGFDDAPESGYLIPPLTTVRQDFAALGQQGISLLLDQFDHTDHTDHTDQPSAPRQVVLPPVLIPRASTAPPG